MELEDLHYKPSKLFLDYLAQKWADCMNETFMKAPLREGSKSGVISHGQLLDRMQTGKFRDGLQGPESIDLIAIISYWSLEKDERNGYIDYLTALIKDQLARQKN